MGLRLCDLGRIGRMDQGHWPELARELELDSATPLELLSMCGGPEAAAADLSGARAMMVRVGGSMLDAAIRRTWGESPDAARCAL